MPSQSKSKKIIITGGAGFVGSNFITHIMDKYQEYEVINLDKLTYCGNLQNLKDIENNPRYTFVQGDIADSKIVDAIAGRGIDAIVNFAAETHVDRSIVDPTAFLHTNIHGTCTLLEAVKKYGIKKFVQISTDEVYGSIEKGSFRETDPLNPSSPYSAAKAGADLLALSYFKTWNLPVSITRCSNNFGPFQYPEKLIPLFITNILENKKIPIYGDGMNVRDWVYVKDHCEAVDMVLHNGENGQIYNIGSSHEKSNLEITHAILKELRGNANDIQYVQDRPGHDRRYSLNCEKIKNELGWQSKYDFNKALTSTIQWYKDNKEWWGKIKSDDYTAYHKK